MQLVDVARLDARVAALVQVQDVAVAEGVLARPFFGSGEQEALVLAVVDIAEDAMIAGERQLVTLNIGTANGVAPGNIFTVYKVMYPSVPTPRNVIGELVVVTVRERTATARVLYSRDAIMNGDKVELR